MEGEGNAPNLNAAIGGGAANQDKGSQAGGHGLCGDLGGRNGFMAGGAYGPTVPRAVYKQGAPMQVKVLVSAYHAGWFEFRLAKPSPANQAVDTTVPITQDLLNVNLLEIDPTTPSYAKVIDYEHMKGYNGNGGEYKCARSGGHTDATSTTPQQVWPFGTCCNGGGTCSAPSANTHRYIIDDDIPFTNVHSKKLYDIRLKIPTSVGTCDRCVLQWAWTTANSQGTYPEAFWNCADIKIESAGFSGTVGCDAGDQGGGSSGGSGGSGGSTNAKCSTLTSSSTPTLSATCTGGTLTGALKANAANIECAGAACTTSDHTKCCASSVAAAKCSTLTDTR